MMNYGLMVVLRMGFLVLLEFVFPGVRFRALGEGTMIFFPRMFGAFAMAVKVAFPVRFIVAFAAVARRAIEAELGIIRVVPKSWGRSRSRGTLHKRGKANLHERRSCDVGVGVPRGRHRRGGRSRFRWVLRKGRRWS